MTDCRKVRALLALPHEDWRAEEMRQVEAHLPGCEACSAAARAYAEQDRLSRALPPATLTPDQRSSLLARVRAEGRRLARPSRRVPGLAGAAAAAVALVLIGLLALLLSNRGGQERGPAVGGPPTPASTATATQAGSAVPTPQASDVSPTLQAAEAVPAPGLAEPGLGRLAYVQDGDLWIRELPDSEPVRLAGEEGSLAISEPRWSPSGGWLAYRRDTAVWLTRANGQDAYAVDQGGVVNAFAWSPVEDRLAYVAGSGVLRLVVLRAGQAESLMLLPPDADGFPGRFAWNPGGDWIAYEWRQGMEAQGLWLIPAGEGAAHEPVALYDSGLPERGEALLAGWTGDGRYLLFWQGEMLSASLLADGAPFYALPAGGGEPLRLPGAPSAVGGDDVVLYHDNFVWSSPSWSVVALTVGGGRETWTNKRVVVADPGAGQVAAVSADDLSAVSPDVSPGGVAYAAAPDAGSVGGGDAAREALFARRIWLFPADGSAPRRLTGEEGYRDERPLWSADGSHLLFVRMDEEETISLWLLPIDGSGPRQVAERLGPWPGDDPGWFGNYGHVDWDALFDWWREPVASTPTPQPTPAPAPAGSMGSDVADLLENLPAAGEAVEPGPPRRQLQFEVYEHPSGAFRLDLPQGFPVETGEDGVSLTLDGSRLRVRFGVPEAPLAAEELKAVIPHLAIALVEGRQIASHSDLEVEGNQAGDAAVGRMAVVADPFGDGEAEIMLWQVEHVLYMMVLITPDYASAQGFWTRAMDSLVPSVESVPLPTAVPPRPTLRPTYTAMPRPSDTPTATPPTATPRP